MFPHERSLVEKYQGRPFALLGVNLDVDAAVLSRVQESEHLNWRSWFDGPGGPIAHAWGVTASATVALRCRWWLGSDNTCTSRAWRPHADSTCCFRLAAGIGGGPWFFGAVGFTSSSKMTVPVVS